jgi:hypothetical protein
MSDENKPFDPFRPSQPRIPGVPSKAAGSGETPAARGGADLRTKLSRVHFPPPWISAVIVAAVVAGIAVAWWSRERPAKELAPPPVEASSVPAIAEPPPKPAEKLAVAPGVVATTDELAKPWSSKRFTYRDPKTTLETPGIVVHLPGGAYWGLSLREPYGTCYLEYVTDLAKLESVYHYRADHPMVGDPCNRTVFDLARFGTNPEGGLVRGAIAQGAGIRPPMAIEIRTKGKQVVAIKME